MPRPPRLLITAGPTYEPIDAVRFLGNRSSGRVGAAVAEESSERGWETTLLLGPNATRPASPLVQVVNFRSVADLDAALHTELPRHDALVMAAAVSDYRPVLTPELLEGKRRRSAGGLTLELEPTPDLLAGAASRARKNQLLCGFALEPENGLLEAARLKLERKRIDCLVANPLETMDSADIRATLLTRDGETFATPGRVSKPAFAAWLLDHLHPMLAARHPEITPFHRLNDATTPAPAHPAAQTPARPAATDDGEPAKTTPHG